MGVPEPRTIIITVTTPEPGGCDGQVALEVPEEGIDQQAQVRVGNNSFLPDEMRVLSDLRQPPDREQCEAVGGSLWDAWLDNAVGTKLLQLRHLAPGLEGARVVISSADSRVLKLPWELLYVEGHHPVAELKAVIWRVHGGIGPKPAVAPRVKAWFGLACPADWGLPPFDTWWCRERILELLQEWGVYADFDPDDVSESIRHAPSPEDFKRALRERHLVYFIGHAEPNPPRLVLIGDRDTLVGEALTASEIARHIGRDVRVLVLNCCSSISVALAIYDYWEQHPDAAPPGLPVIVATQWAWPCSSAMQIHRDVLESLVLGRHRSLTDALHQFRGRSNTASPTDWAAPTILGPGGSGQAGELDLLERPVRMLVPVASQEGPTVGPIGLDEGQCQHAREVLEQVAATPRGVRALLEAFLDQQRHDAQSRLDPFEIYAYPVTVQMWRQVMGDEAGSVSGDPAAPAAVTYGQAREFCRKVGARLPTRDEWERAARGDARTILPWTPEGETDDLVNGWVLDNELCCNVLEAGRAGPTSIFDTQAGASSFGVFDMVGNVAEWACDPREGEEGRPMVMGKGFKYPLLANIPSFAWAPGGDLERHRYGFRCVRDL